MAKTIEVATASNPRPLADDLNEAVAHELAGKSRAWWMSKLTAERRRAMHAETELESATTELATTKDELVRTVHERDGIIAERDTVVGEVALLRDRVAKLNPDTVFELMVQEWERDLDAEIERGARE